MSRPIAEATVIIRGGWKEAYEKDHFSRERSHWFRQGIWDFVNNHGVIQLNTDECAEWNRGFDFAYFKAHRKAKSIERSRREKNESSS